MQSYNDLLILNLTLHAGNAEVVLGFVESACAEKISRFFA